MLPAFVFRIAYDIVQEGLSKEDGVRRMLQRAGLERYVGNPPPISTEPAITLEEYQRLVYAIHDVFEEDVAKQILEDAGERAFQEFRDSYFLSFRSFLHAFEKGMDARQRTLLALKRLMTDLSDVMGYSHELTQVDDDLIIDMHDCPYCAQMAKRAHRPICYLPAAFYRAAVRWVTGEEHAVKEIACRTLGDDSCRFRISWGIILRASE